MMKTGFVSLAQLRQEKAAARRQVEYDVRRLRNDIDDVVHCRFGLPRTSSNKYLNYLSYAFSAFKIAATVMSVVRLFKRKKK